MNKIRLRKIGSGSTAPIRRVTASGAGLGLLAQAALLEARSSRPVPGTEPGRHGQRLNKQQSKHRDGTTPSSENPP